MKGKKNKASIDARAWRAPDGINFAWGGAISETWSPTPAGISVPGLLGQIEFYKHRFNWLNGTAPDTLFAIWIGADDFLLSPTQAVDPSVVVDNIVNGIQRLHALGARRFLIANLPELCALPVAAGDPASNPPVPPLVGCGGFLDDPTSTPTWSFNDELQWALDSLSNLSGTEIHLVDVYSAAQAVYPLTAGPATGCLFSLPDDPSACEPGPTFDPLWLNEFSQYNNTALWDEQHPTTLLHSIIATEAAAVLSASPL